MEERQRSTSSSDNGGLEKEIEHTGSRSPTPSIHKTAIEKDADADGPNALSTTKEVDPEQVPVARPFGSDAPDGGLKAWLVILGVWCCSFCSYGWMNSIGIFQEYYQTTLLNTYSASAISWIPSLQVFLMTALGPFIGIIYDRHGPRMLLLVGSFLHVFGIMMASLGTKYYQLLLAQGVCSALGVACIFQPGKLISPASTYIFCTDLVQLSRQQEVGSTRKEEQHLELPSRDPAWEVSYSQS